MSKVKSVRLSDVRKLAMLQCTRTEAAACLGISQAKWRVLLNEDERVKKVWEEGFEKGKMSLRRKQLRLATSNAQMAIHLGKQYLSQTDSRSVELTGPGGGPLESVDLTKLSQDERRQLRTLLTRSASDPSSA